jgi:hypothetical protein
MGSTRWAYPSEKFEAARRGLMAPHPNGEAKSFVAALHECQLGLHGVSVDNLDDDARHWVRTLEEAFDDTGVEDPDGRGTWIHKMEGLDTEELSRISDAVNGLATWFHDRSCGLE